MINFAWLSAKQMKNRQGNSFRINRHLILYGISLSILLFLLKWFQWKFLIIDNSTDIYIALVALLFTILGMWIARQLSKPKTIVIEKTETVVVEKIVYTDAPSGFKLNKEELDKLKLSKREHEVLILVTEGLSNAEIADKLCLSLSTIKTHVSNLLLKMEVKRRAQLIEKSKRLKITP